VEEDADERMDLLASPFGSEMSFSTLMSEFPRYSSRLSLSGRKVVIAPVAKMQECLQSRKRLWYFSRTILQRSAGYSELSHAK
jgi:hypothetical protein